MRYTISYEIHAISNVIAVEARTPQMARSYFLSQHPNARIFGIREMEMCDLKPGLPIMTVPDDENALKEFLFWKTLNARRAIVKYGDRSLRGSYAADVWGFMEPLLAEAGLWDEYEIWEQRHGGVDI